MSVPKDGVAANTHAHNLLPAGASPPAVDRIPLYEVYMRMAEELAKRSTCIRLQVGTVVTDQRLEHVLAIGYNGNARGLPNTCDSAVPGNCGCIHSEMNALVKAPGTARDKVVFVSASPCVMCAKLIINSGVTHVFYRRAYRDPSGVEVLRQGGVVPVLYDRWRSEWREPAGAAPAVSSPALR
ncbi:MAG: deoxycytidylate deaminase [Gemmatimonadales bacterium]